MMNITWRKKKLYSALTAHSALYTSAVSEFSFHGEYDCEGRITERSPGRLLPVMTAFSALHLDPNSA